MKKLFKLLLILTVLTVISACGSGDRTYGGGSVAMAPAPAAAPAAPAVDSADVGFTMESAAQTNFLDRMVIRNAHLSMETERFDRTVHEVERIVEIYGGFIESSNHWLSHARDREEAFWFADFTLRVPVDHFDAANRDIKALGLVVSFSTTSEDVTMQFQDLESRLRIREEEERRILTMIENTTDLDELIRLETRLANLRIVMERYQRHKTEIDHLASFSTIHLSLREVESEDATAILQVDSFTNRMTTAFSDSIEFSLALIEGFVVLIAAVILPIAIIAAPILLVLYLRKRSPLSESLSKEQQS